MVEDFFKKITFNCLSFWFNFNILFCPKEYKDCELTFFFLLLSQKTKLLIYFCSPKLKLYEEHKIFLGVSFIFPCFTALLSILRKAVFFPLLFSMFLFTCQL